MSAEATGPRMGVEGSALQKVIHGNAQRQGGAPSWPPEDGGASLGAEVPGPSLRCVTKHLPR